MVERQFIATFADSKLKLQLRAIVFENWQDVAAGMITHSTLL